MVKRLAVFASGNGTNFTALWQAIQDRQLPATIALLVCDHADAPVIQRAQAARVPVFCLDFKAYATKAEAETVILDQLRAAQVTAILLAGYMRLIGPTLLAAYPQRIINLHPALLPHFPGRHSIEDALAAKVTTTGVTIHFVDAGIDTGQIIGQRAVPILPTDTYATLAPRIHAVEHQFYPDTLQQLLAQQRI
ncbi:phosphoribosylglycinamide formyltransferase [Levilactobacillus suantsaiihabitans]|uniref:Phosphoribosylglycinamide formyltransferase n=1 Tax=Levilactobacillus suantsaiihabitans TaxID=2487722 RepID=A0A4Z0J7C0_9LACO|nr:phosphoribosylglycinamide formyltransferase [Levilactobacillus suantsaiihabitans]TGD18084.1 phosphoribosylglycinamide formyltransferase [Levilactobacillus suantsaiihabitans]